METRTLHLGSRQINVFYGVVCAGKGEVCEVALRRVRAPAEPYNMAFFSVVQARKTPPMDNYRYYTMGRDEKSIETDDFSKNCGIACVWECAYLGRLG